MDAKDPLFLNHCPTDKSTKKNHPESTKKKKKKGNEAREDYEL